MVTIKTIKTKSVRVGDWCEVKGQVVRFMVYDWHAVLFPEEVLNEVQAIPITEEILKLNGFKKVKEKEGILTRTNVEWPEDNWYCILGDEKMAIAKDMIAYDPGRKILRHYEARFKWGSEIISYLVVRNFNTDISFVHELQHALELYKVDMDVQL